MQVTAKGIVVSALMLCLSGTVYAQGAGGGGAGGGQGGTGMSKPNASGPTDTVSGASGANTMAPATGTTSHKMTHKKAHTAMPSSAPAPSSGGG